MLLCSFFFLFLVLNCSENIVNHAQVAAFTTTTATTKRMVVTPRTTMTTTAPSRQPVVSGRTSPLLKTTTTTTTTTTTSSLSASSMKQQDRTTTAEQLIGDDSAYFSLQEQSLMKWIQFGVSVSIVLAAVAYVWVLPAGLHGGDIFLDSIQAATGTADPAVTVFAMLAVFAVTHSGLAAARPAAERAVGPKAWRWVFALASLPLALSCVSYFINHAHEGQQLWDITAVPGVHAAVWVSNFVSFLFLYPSTFNLLEVAAVDTPELHLWETGIIRITRHPQAVGQLLWCAAHTAWLGTTTAAAASAMLVLHHAFAVWHGDQRLQDRHGDNFEYLKSKTSVVPFQAILEGRQELPADYYKEFLRAPYAVVVGGTLAAYVAHPFLLAGASMLNW